MSAPHPFHVMTKPIGARCNIDCSYCYYLEKEKLYPDDDEWINPGDSVVVGPDGEIAAGPLRKESGILYCDLDVEQVGPAKRTLDVTGHYSRPDIFTLHVNTKPQSPVNFSNES